MATRMTSPLAGIRWLRNAVNVGGRKPGTLMLAALMLFAICLLPTLVTLPVQLMFPGSMPAFLGVMAFSLVVGLALSPVLAGFLQVIDAIERGQPVRARDLFAPYRNGLAKPVIGFALLLMLVYIAMAVLVMLAAGSEMRGLYVDLLNGVQPEPTTEMPSGFWRAWGLGMVLAVIVGGIWAIGYGQVAIGRRPVIEAFVDGVTGTLKNLLPILVLIVTLILAFFVLGIAMVLVVAALSLIGKFVGAWLAFVLVAPVYVAFLLAIYVVLFALAYFFWRDVCAVDADAAANTVIAEA